LIERRGELSTTKRPRVRASAVLMRKHYVRDRHGVHAEARYLAAASPELAATLQTAEKVDDWVDFALFVEATELVDKLFGRGDLMLAWDVGRFAAEHNLGVWKALVMKVLSPKTVINIATGLWGHHYDSGKLQATEEGTHGLRLRIVDFPTPARAHCLSIGGWTERTLELGRPKSVTVREEKCRVKGADACELTLLWR
jgi:hypothetical protein